MITSGSVCINRSVVVSAREKEDGYCALHYAVRNSDIALVRTLLGLGANINTQSVSRLSLALLLLFGSSLLRGACSSLQCCL